MPASAHEVNWKDGSSLKLKVNRHGAVVPDDDDGEGLPQDGRLATEESEDVEEDQVEEEEEEEDEEDETGEEDDEEDDDEEDEDEEEEEKEKKGKKLERPGKAADALLESKLLGPAGRYENFRFERFLEVL